MQKELRGSRLSKGRTGGTGSGERRGNYTIACYSNWINLDRRNLTKLFTASTTLFDRTDSTALIQPLAANQLIQFFYLQGYLSKHAISGQLTFEQTAIHQKLPPRSLTYYNNSASIRPSITPLYNNPFLPTSLLSSATSRNKFRPSPRI